MDAFQREYRLFRAFRKRFHVNFRVADIEGLLKELKEAGIEQIDDLQVFDYGKFAHIMDPEGNKIELWEANDDGFEKNDNATSG